MLFYCLSRMVKTEDPAENFHGGQLSDHIRVLCLQEVLLNIVGKAETLCDPAIAKESLVYA